ncbi:condensation domain-containing protein [Thermodesulfobacteriota bacterium]
MIYKRSNIKTKKYLASKVQKQFWLLQQFRPDSPAYNVPALFKVEGQIDIRVLNKCVNEMILEYDTLRTRFVNEKGELYQVILPEQYIEIEVIDLQNKSKINDSTDKYRILEKLAAKPFNMYTEPLIRISLVKNSYKEFFILFVMHHSISDLESLSIFLQELAEKYNDMSLTGKMPERSKKKQYIEYAKWQNNWVNCDEIKQKLEFWNEELKSQSGYLKLPINHEREGNQTDRGGEYRTIIEEEINNKIIEYSSQKKVSTFATMLSAFYCLLAFYSKQNDIIVGIPFANRLQKSAKKNPRLFR